MQFYQNIAQIRSSSRALVRELNVLQGAFQDTGFTYSQCHILFELDQHKRLNLVELSEIVRLDKSTTSRIVKSLVEKGLIEVGKNTSDQRQKLFSLTSKGKEATNCNNELASRQVEEAIALLVEEEQEAVKKGLYYYAKALSQSRKQQDYIIRPIEKEDNLVIASILRKVMQEFDAAGEGSSYHDTEIDRMFEAFNQPKAAFFVIGKGNEVFGGAGIAPLKGGDLDTCELQKMYFLPKLRGMGMGKRLLLHCLKEAKALGYKKCYLETAARMSQANFLYRKMGFQKLEKQLGCTGHSACDTMYIKTLQ